MTSFKYLVTILGLLLAGSSAGWAADDSVDTGAASTTTAPAGTPATPKLHHRKHHAKSTAAAGTATATPAAQTATSNPSTSTPRKSGGIESQPSEAADDHSSPSAPATTASTPPAATHHLHHHHPAAEAATTSTNAAPAIAGTAAAPAAVTQAKTAKGHHHRHGKPLPEPPIVVQQTSTPLPAPPPANAVTLPTPPPVSAVPIVQTGLPVPRPGTGTTATLPIAPVRPPPPAALFNFSFHDEPLPRPHTRTYPWKSRIVTTVFWIGEGSTPISSATNKQSAWDMYWVHHNGGADDQNDMSGYASSEHASTLNPFYVALPFNDLAYPDKTERWLPEGWYKRTPHGEKPVSACQGRWIEIKNQAGRYCFAQWEDVGPMVTDDAEYVFGPEAPRAGRGLDVSPAVAKYLGFDSTAITSWRFVDDADVLPGMWLRYDEQALLFRAMKEEMHGNPTPRIQDMDEPVPDPEDSSQKKAGAARG